MTDNPFSKHADILRADYGAAVRIKALVLHLYKGYQAHRCRNIR
jgi:hypothetical protein